LPKLPHGFEQDSRNFAQPLAGLALLVAHTPSSMVR
jgi:hypothetical protein